MSEPQNIKDQGRVKAKGNMDDFYAFHEQIMGPGKWVDAPGYKGIPGSRVWVSTRKKVNK